MLSSATALLALALSPGVPPGTTVGLPTGETEDAARELCRIHPAPEVTFEVERVVDGDTLHILRGGEREKLRLLSVDTEERLSGRPPSSPTKPETVFGEECALWAVEFFAAEAGEGERPRVGLVFPDGREQRDVYGRLLCHVVLEDGTDFQLLLVELGKSPYFDKYGPSRVCHLHFREAQDRARKARRGIWDPATNRPADPEAPAAIRPYDRLLPWWSARARAVALFRERAALWPTRCIDGEDPGGLAAALRGGHEVDVLCSIARIFEEDDGARTVLMRSGDRDMSLRVRIEPGAKADHGGLDLEGSMDEFRQNYWIVSGRIERGARGPRMVSAGPDSWRLAGPEPR